MPVYMFLFIFMLFSKENLQRLFSALALDNFNSLKGQCHQIRMILKWGSFKGISYDMRRLIFKIFWSLSLIYYRHFNFLSWGSKSVPIFYFVLNLIWGCSKWVQIALFVSWNNSDFQCLFLIGCLIFAHFLQYCSICILKVAGVRYHCGGWSEELNSRILHLAYMVYL